jgi:UDP-N-acetylglucosamine acyltransferase
VSAKIHAWASVDPAARVADEAEVGPFCVVGPDVSLGPNTTLINHCTVIGHTTIGAGNIIYPYTVMGGKPQVKWVEAGQGRLVIGDGNVFREYVTVNVGVVRYGGTTRVGGQGLYMACCHVAHDCTVGDDVILGNAVLLGGHITVGDGVCISAASAAHHFTTFGRLAFVGGMSRIVHDVPPFVKAEGSPARVRAINDVGLERHGFDEMQIQALRAAYRLIWRGDLPRSQALAAIEHDGAATVEVRELVAFLRCAEHGKHGRAKEAERV